MSTPPQPNSPKSEGRLYALTIGLGVAVWLVPWLLLGRKEAWDHSSYFLFSIPLMTLAAGYAGYRARTRAWRWPLALILGQFATLLLQQGFGNLLPLGIIVFVILGVPMMVGASIGARVGRRNDRRSPQGRNEREVAPQAPHARRATLEERVRWHAAHAKACGCREMPASILKELRKRRSRAP